MNRKLPDEKWPTDRLAEGELTGTIIRSFYRVYDGLKFGHLEAVYRNALAMELRTEGLEALVETPVEVFYKGTVVGFYRLDVLVEHRVAVEVKATEVIAPNAKRQLLNYLRASTLDVGLLLHFGPKARFDRVVSPRLLDRERQQESGIVRPTPALSGHPAFQMREERTGPDKTQAPPDACRG
jgi:GxxExxY protein